MVKNQILIAGSIGAIFLVGILFWMNRKNNANIGLPQPTAGYATTAPQQPPVLAVYNPSYAISRLLRGNQRFIRGRMYHPHQYPYRRTETALSQKPYAIILCCSDSSAPPEIIFDEGIGDLFVVRNYGNLLNDFVIGSIEYAVEHLKVQLILVMGHTKCGAVTAAVQGVNNLGKIPTIVNYLQQAVAIAKTLPGDTVMNTVRVNAKLNASALSKQSPILSAAFNAKTLYVVPACYNIATGIIEILY
jgi:carbonic anhydrase